MKEINDEIGTALGALEKLFADGDSPLANDYRRYQLSLNWSQYVGKTAATKCSPVAIFNSVLYIWVCHSSWLHQLHFMKDDILERVQRYMGKDRVTAIRFTQNWQDVPKGEQSTPDQQGDQKPESPSEGGGPRPFLSRLKKL